MTHLETVVAGSIWSFRHKVRIGPLSIPVRSTIVKLTDGRLWIASPPKPTPDLLEALDGIGPIGYVVAPNLQHHSFFAEFLAEVPDAEGYLAPGLPEKISAPSNCRILAEQDWADELPGVFIEGLPVLNETVWIHRATGSLIVTDLLFDFGADNPLLLRLMARLLGVDRRLGMSWTMKRAVKDRTAFGHSLDRIMSHRIDRVIMAHDQIIEGDVTDQLTAAWSWLRP
ncbi:DUF4336 domain-containing protein [Algihabitans albus]|uniref:DUF4336 domain-containing protein n=1 Tax=Algihabitans albus TaxID=2164067 RepID=UPI0013C344F3|nr:DUF4336 domain-containing protein [Algihabitans albus]